MVDIFLTGEKNQQSGCSSGGIACEFPQCVIMQILIKEGRK